MTQKYSLPDLPYDFGDLEPVISGEIMELHYKKHHQGYVNKFNEALEKYEEADAVGKMQLLSALKFNGGGHINHALFWENLAPEGQGGTPQGALKTSLEKHWGSVEKFIEDFNAMAAGIQGSGWAWLCCKPKTKCLFIHPMSNQDPLCLIGAVPLLGIDVWEHAYYLQYKNVRPDYLKNIWRVINWQNVEKRYNDAD